SARLHGAQQIGQDVGADFGRNDRQAQVLEEIPQRLAFRTPQGRRGWRRRRRAGGDRDRRGTLDDHGAWRGASLALLKSRGGGPGGRAGDGGPRGGRKIDRRFADGLLTPYLELFVRLLHQFVIEDEFVAGLDQEVAGRGLNPDSDRVLPVLSRFAHQRRK